MSDEPNPATENGAVEREGLPRGYRMRADKHYVDQLAAAPEGQPVRMLPPDQIDGEASSPQIDLRLLIESIRTHGIVRPLLVRRKGSRYIVIAGHRRLAGANVLHLAGVPCVVHDVDEVQAAALAEADNVTAPSIDRDASSSGLPAAVRQIVADHIAKITTCTDAAMGAAPTLTRRMLDLIKVHAWRAGRLGDALDLILNVPPPPERDRAISTIADAVIDGFAPECRLNDCTLRAQIRDDLSSSGVNPHDLHAGLSAALLATLPLVEHAERPTVVIKGAAGASGSGWIVMEVSQTDVPLAPGLLRHYFDDEAAYHRPGGYAAVAGAMAVKALAERYGGTAMFDALPNGGSTLRMMLVRRS